MIRPYVGRCLAIAICSILYGITMFIESFKLVIAETVPGDSRFDRVFLQLQIAWGSRRNSTRAETQHFGASNQRKNSPVFLPVDNTRSSIIPRQAHSSLIQAISSIKKQSTYSDQKSHISREQRLSKLSKDIHRSADNVSFHSEQLLPSFQVHVPRELQGSNPLSILTSPSSEIAPALLQPPEASSVSLKPTVVTSEAPSSFPSIESSNLLSLTISETPTLLPTVTVPSISSDFPSEAPIVFYSPSIDHDIFSEASQPISSYQPQDPSYVSVIPYPNSISSVPTIAPSDLPSIRASRLVSFEPSVIPSDEPSKSPSTWDQDPRFVSSSFERSDTPSEWPSFSPSIPPAYMATKVPTEIPSVIPSVAPSFAPSEKCHDSESYRSPLNNFTCTDHKETDCTQWSYLGLKPDQVENLINSCPISCMIGCGTLQRFDMNASYSLSKVDNYLAPESVQVLESVSVDYLKKYIEQRQQTGKFSFYQAKLLSQTIISREPKYIRALQEESLDLAISCAFSGFVINIEPTAIEKNIIDGLDSVGFVNALRSSGDRTYAYVDVFSALNGTTEEIVPVPADGGRRRSPGVISASIIAGLVAVITLSGLFFYKSRKKIQSQPYMNDKEDESEVHSPQSSVKSPILGVFSFESVMRLISSAGSPRSDDSSTSPGLSSESEQIPNAEKEIQQPVDIAPSHSEEIVHPLTGIIPPMIVIDLNDEEVGNAKHLESPKRKSTEVVPVIHLTASPSFRHSLCEEPATAFNESMYEGINVKDNDLQLEPYMGSTSAETSDSNHSQNSASTHSDLADTTDDIQRLRISTSESGIDKASLSQTKKHFRSFSLRRKRSWIDSGDFALSPIGGSPVPRIEETEADDSENDNTTDIPPMDRERASEIESNIRSKSTEAGSRFIQSIMSFGSRHLRKPSTGQDTAKPGYEKVSDDIGTNSFEKPPLGEKLPSADGKLLIFWAPIKGKLGLLIQSIEDIGPVVTQVKDYSPLLGQVVEGDRIIEIDGVSTVGMPISEVLTTISDKQASRRSTMLRLVVWRSSAPSPQSDDIFDQFLPNDDDDATFNVDGEDDDDPVVQPSWSSSTNPSHDNEHHQSTIPPLPNPNQTHEVDEYDDDFFRFF